MMKPVQSIESFFADYFQSRTEVLERTTAAWASHENRFYSGDYRYLNHAAAARTSREERILEIQSAEKPVYVITSGFLESKYKLRYQLSVDEGMWRIHRIELECGLCRGSGIRKDGSTPCRLCKGAGWKLLGVYRDV